jgi:hypothetical protein
MERDYAEVVEGWIREFICTMDDGHLRAGDDSGEAPFGVKIIFDGYGEDDDGNEDLNTESFAVFVHKNSLTEEFPEHDQTPWALIHRPKEEVCIWAWYDCNSDEVTIIPFEESDSTQLDHDFIIDTIFKIQERDTV